MKKAALRFPLAICLVLGHVAVAMAQEAPPHLGEQGPGMSMRPSSAEEREQRRADHMQQRQWREQQREAWRQMSPEERQQLRSDIRDAGRSLYPRHAHGREGRR